MRTYTYISEGEFGLVDKPKPVIMHERDAIVKVTLASICSSDLHIKHGSVPRAVKGITVLIIGAGPTGICTLLCVMLKNPKKVIVCEKDADRIRFINDHYPNVLTVAPEECFDFVHKNSDHGGADVVLEVAGAESSIQNHSLPIPIPLIKSRKHIICLKIK